MPKPLSGHKRSGLRVVHVGLCLIVASLLASFLAAWGLRVEAGDVARRHMENLGVLVAKQAGSSIQAVDLVLQDVQATIAATGITDPDRFRQRFAAATFRDFLAHRLVALSQSDAIVVVGADGRLVTTSRSWPTPALDLSDRDYYTYFKTHDDRTAYVSEPVRNRTTGTPTIFIVRRLNGPGGEFIGLLLGSMTLKYFEDLYTGIGLSEGTGVTLLRRDGLVLIQYPPPETVVLRMPAASPWYRLSQSGGGSYRSPGFLGASTRFVSVHPLGEYPVVVDASVSEDSAYTLWRRQASFIGIGAGCAVLAILTLLRALLAQFRGLEESRIAVDRRNRELELARARLERQAGEMRQTATALRESELRLLEKSRLLETTLEHMDQGLMMVNGAGIVAVCNRKAVAMLDLPPELMQTQPPFVSILEHQWRTEEFTAVDAKVKGYLNSGILETAHSYERRRPNGQLLEIRGVPIAGGGFVRTYTDVTDRKATQERVHYLAHHDELTDLANRVVFREHLEQQLRLRRHSDSVAVLCLDLDHFKNINDTLGHPVGDMLLRAVAARLRDSVRETDIVARLGGDEFAIVQTGVEQPAQATALAERLTALLAQPFDLDGSQVTIGTSLGISIGANDGVSADTLLKNADMALYGAKAAGRGTYRFFEPAMDAQVQARRALETDLRGALANHEFELFFQPMLHAQTGILSGFEALIRWRHKRRGMVAPAEFIPLAEEIGLIAPIGEWVLREACRQAATWPGNIKVAVNLSPAQFRTHHLADTVSEALEASGLPHNRLELEITESVLLQNTGTTLDILHRLRAMGLAISLDDFGTGYSSLGYLRSFPFDKIKIDQSFVRDLQTGPDSLAIVHAILDLGRTLGMSVTAEGVETADQLRLLQQEGCTEVQGYLFSAPRPAGEALALITQFGPRIREVA